VWSLAAIAGGPKHPRSGMPRKVEDMAGHMDATVITLTTLVFSLRTIPNREPDTGLWLRLLVSFRSPSAYLAVAAWVIGGT
jgi:hypothetical protein